MTKKHYQKKDKVKDNSSKLLGYGSIFIIFDVFNNSHIKYTLILLKQISRI